MSQIHWRTLTSAAWAAIALGGCATLPDAQDLRAEPFVYRTIPGAATVGDGRGAFRRVFCAELETDGLGNGDDPYCSRWLWLLPIRDLFAFATWGLAFAGQRVRWRGHLFRLLPGGRIVELPEKK